MALLGLGPTAGFQGASVLHAGVAAHGAVMLLSPAPMSIARCTAAVLVLLDLKSSFRAAPLLRTVLPQALPCAASTQRLCFRSAWGPGLGLGLAALRCGVRAPSDSCGEKVSLARPAAALAAAAAAMRWARRRSLPPNVYLQVCQKSVKNVALLTAHRLVHVNSLA